GESCHPAEAASNTSLGRRGRRPSRALRGSGAEVLGDGGHARSGTGPVIFSATMAVASETPASFRSSAIRPRPFALVLQGFNELFSRRRLIRYLVRADLKRAGSDTLLGNIWWVIDPLLQMLVYVVLVSVIFARPQPDYALFVFSAILPWKWFTTSINDGIASVVGMERIIKQINFPKLVLPVSAVFGGIAN